MQQGITAVQSCRPDGIFRGRSFVAILGEGLPNDLIIKPFSHHMVSFNKGSFRQEYPGSLMGSIALVRQTFYDVDWYRRAHKAFRTNPDQKMPEFNSAIKALGDAENDGIVFFTSDELSLLRANHLLRELNVPFILVGSGRNYIVADDIAKIKPDLIIPVNYPKTPSIENFEDELDVTLGELRHWERAPENAAILSGKGINFSFTAQGLDKKDTFLKNVRKAVKYGLSPQTALEALTVIPAKQCGVQDMMGTLEPGKLANFFICDGDIFDDDANIYSAWTKGHEFELESRPIVDYRGTYKMKLAGGLFKITISGRPDHPKGEFALDNLKGGLDGFEVRDEKLFFNLSLDTLGSNDPGFHLRDTLVY